jgi:WD40 repeat protein
MWNLVNQCQSVEQIPSPSYTVYIIYFISSPINQSINQWINQCTNQYSYYRHHDHCVLFTGNKGQQHAIHYWSLHDNKILRKFRGHSDVVTDASLNPGEDMFLTASRDRTVRLWNIQQAGCIAQMDFPSETIGTPHVAFDSTGMVFTVMAEMAGGKGNVSTSTSTITANPYFHYSSVWPSCCCLVFCFHYYTTILLLLYLCIYIIYYTHV